MKISEFLQPLKNVDEMFTNFSEGDYIQGARDYVESVPGIVALGKLGAKLSPMVFKQGIASPIAKTISGIGSWYAKPITAFGNLSTKAAQASAKTAAAKAKTLSTAKLLTTAKILGPLAAATALQHAGSRVLKNRLSLVDVIHLALGNKPTQFQDTLMRKPTKWYDWLIGDPVTKFIGRAITPGKQKPSKKEKKEEES